MNAPRPTVEQTLVAALKGEFAAIFAYGVVGPNLAGGARILAFEHEAAHRTQRDTMLDTMNAPPAGDPVYSLPFPVVDARTAIALAVWVEEHCAQLWRDVVVATDPSARPSPLGVLTNTALRAAAWRRMGGANPGTVAFPGLTA
jgi:hypothetical protein